MPKKGRSEFTAAEIDLIRRIVRDKTNNEKGAQKRLRELLRGCGFYISDFGDFHEGFTEADLDKLIKTGEITIRG